MEWNEIWKFHQRFPHLLRPWTGMDDDEKGPKGPHCCGGILVMCLEGITDPRRASVYDRFPNAVVLAQALRKANPFLKPKKARKSARRIIAWNDAEEFPAAFQILKNALEFGQHPTLTEELLDRQLAEILKGMGKRQFTAA